MSAWGGGGNGEVPHVLEKKGDALIPRKTGIRFCEFRSPRSVGKHGFPSEREPKASGAHFLSPSRHAAAAATNGTPAGAIGSNTSVISAESAEAASALRPVRYGIASPRNRVANAASRPSELGSARVLPRIAPIAVLETQRT